MVLYEGSPAYAGLDPRYPIMRAARPRAVRQQPDPGALAQARSSPAAASRSPRCSSRSPPAPVPSPARPRLPVQQPGQRLPGAAQPRRRLRHRQLGGLQIVAPVSPLDGMDSASPMIAVPLRSMVVDEVHIHGLVVLARVHVRVDFPPDQRGVFRSHTRTHVTGGAGEVRLPDTRRTRRPSWQSTRPSNGRITRSTRGGVARRSRPPATTATPRSGRSGPATACGAQGRRGAS